MTEDGKLPPDVETASGSGRQGHKPIRWTTSLLPALSAAFAVVAVLAVQKVITVLGLLNLGLGLAVLLLAAALFVVLGYKAGLRAAVNTPGDRKPAPLAGLMATYAGIAAGVIFWALGVEELILKHFGVYPIYEEHTLFPIEVVVWWIAATIPILTGLGLARFRLRRGDAAASDRMDG